MTFEEAKNAVVAGAAFIGGLAVFWRMLVQPLVRRAVVQFQDAVEKVMAPTRDQVSKIERRTQELVGNGGSSLKDMVTQIKERQNAAVVAQQTELVKVWRAIAQLRGRGPHVRTRATDPPEDRDEWDMPEELVNAPDEDEEDPA